MLNRTTTHTLSPLPLMSVFALVFLVLAVLVAGQIVAFASYSSSQIVYDDDAYTTYSIYIFCPVPQCANQNGQSAFQCVGTPNTITQDYNWWWYGQATIYKYSSTSCSGTPFASATINIGTSNPNPWYCYDTTYGGFNC